MRTKLHIFNLDGVLYIYFAIAIIVLISVIFATAMCSNQINSSLSIKIIARNADEIVVMVEQNQSAKH